MIRHPQPLRTAVIGAGYLGRFHAQKYAALPGVELVAVVDVDGDRARAVAAETGATAYTDLSQVPGPLHAASVVVPNTEHHAVARALLAAGVHVLLEKPLTSTVAQADELIALAQERGVVLQAGHLERFNPAVQHLFSHVREPLFIEAHRLSGFKARATDVDVVLDLMIHDIDIALGLVGAPVREIRASGYPVLTDKVDIANARIEFVGGCTANLTASRVSLKEMRKVRVFQKGAYLAADCAKRENVIAMADVLHKSLDDPDEVVEFPGVRTELVDLGDMTVGRMVNEPGWRWSTHVRPTVGGEWCQVRHVGIVLEGRLGIEFPDGTSVVFGPGAVFDIPPGHDGFTVGDEPVVQIEWAGLRAWAGFPTGIRSRVLATLLFTDLVGSTELASRLGDGPWRHLLSGHFEAVRAELERFGGREVKTTGDGMLATFDGAARALHCAVAMRRLAGRDGLRVRTGVHVGEVELVGADVRGVTVHEAARIMAAAGPDEILASDLTRALAGGAGFAFEDRGTHTLKGLEGEWKLWAFVGEQE